MTRYWLRLPQGLDLINQRLLVAESERVLLMTTKGLVTLMQVTQKHLPTRTRQKP
jgi:hypothetical protein